MNMFAYTCSFGLSLLCSYLIENVSVYYGFGEMMLIAFLAMVISYFIKEDLKKLEFER